LSLRKTHPQVKSATCAVEHGRRRVVHFNATYNPTSAWVIQQLREAFPFDTAPRHLVFDRDATFSAAVSGFVRSMGNQAVPNRAEKSLAERFGGALDR
jgi:hypothetical protein